MIGLFGKRIWIWIVIAFLVMISAWVVLFKLAFEHRPVSFKAGEELPEGVVPGSGHPGVRANNLGEKGERP